MYARPLLIGSYISRRCPYLARPAVRAEGGWDVPSNTFLLCQIGSSGVLLKSTRGNLLSSPLAPSGAYSAALGLLSGQGFASLRSAAPRP